MIEDLAGWSLVALDSTLLSPRTKRTRFKSSKSYCFAQRDEDFVLGIFGHFPGEMKKQNTRPFIVFQNAFWFIFSTKPYKTRLKFINLCNSSEPRNLMHNMQK